MKILLQLGGLFLLCLFGELIAALLPFSFPAGVLCMILLFFGFLFHIVRPESLRETSDFLLNNMAFFFVPAGVGIIKYYGLIQSAVVPILIICVVSTILTFAATAYTVRLVSALQKKHRERGQHHA